jgi:hypothetical protein
MQELFLAAMVTGLSAFGAAFAGLATPRWVTWF